MGRGIPVGRVMASFIESFLVWLLLLAQYEVEAYRLILLLEGNEKRGSSATRLMPE